MMLFELIQVALGSKVVLSHTPSKEEWWEIYHQAEKQAVVGVCFQGGQQLKEQQYPPKDLLFQWIAVAEQIKKLNVLAFRRSHEITKLFAESGFRSCILKGQGNALMYANPYSRMSGDIDIWVDGSREEINKFVKGKCPDAFEQEHHIEFPLIKDIEIEVHYTPGILLSPFLNKKYQKWCDAQKNNFELCSVGGVGSFNIPSTLFNVVFQMAHIMDHFFVEGIGLRHFVDYYYVLNKCYEEKLDTSEINLLFDRFGLTRFAKGVMWIEKECLGVADKCLIVGFDKRIGQVILKEMIEGGNFGHYDDRFKIRKKGYLARGIADGYRLLRLTFVFPSETMWKLYRKVVNQRWKLK